MYITWTIVIRSKKKKVHSYLFQSELPEWERTFTEQSSVKKELNSDLFQLELPELDRTFAEQIKVIVENQTQYLNADNITVHQVRLTITGNEQQNASVDVVHVKFLQEITMKEDTSNMRHLYYSDIRIKYEDSIFE